MPVPAVVSLVTLAVRDVAASTAFYAALGWQLSGSSVPGEVSFFRTAGGLLGLYGADALRADCAGGPAATPGSFGGVTLAINLGSPAEVDSALDAAARVGAQVVKAPQPTEWGGYHGYFADPDGHRWEVAHNPFWPLDSTGLPVLPH